MRKTSVERILGLWLPVTGAVLVLFAGLVMAAFANSATTAGFVFATMAGLAAVAVLLELLLAYESLVDRWFRRDRSIIAAVWFVVSLCLAVWLTPDKTVDWQTVVTVAIVFAVLFFVPYLLAMKFGRRIMQYISARLGIFRKSDNEHGQIDAVLAQTSDPKRMDTDEEIRKYDTLIAALSPDLVKSLPQPLQSRDALFLLVLLSEEGFLDNKFRPLIMDGRTGKPNQSLYAYIAHAMSLSLVIADKWHVFEPFWSLRNGAQLLSNHLSKTRDEPTEYQRRIARLFRKATRIRPSLETRDLKLITDV